MRTIEEQLSFAIARLNDPSAGEGEKQYCKKEKNGVMIGRTGYMKSIGRTVIF